MTKKLDLVLKYVQEINWHPVAHVLCFLIVFFSMRGAILPRPEHITIEDSDVVGEWYASRRVLYGIFAGGELIMTAFFLFAVALFFWPHKMLKRTTAKYGSPDPSAKKKRKTKDGGKNKPESSSSSKPNFFSSCYRFLFKEDLEQEEPPFLRPFRIVDGVAVVLCVFGSQLRQAAFDELGRMFTYAVTIKQDHELIGTGPYSLLIHPSYTGAILCILAGLFYIGLRSRAWVLISAVTFVGLLSFRISNEEQVLAANFGEKWVEFSQTRWRLVPFVF